MINQKYINAIENISQNALKLTDRIDGAFFKSFESDNVIYANSRFTEKIDTKRINKDNILIIRDDDFPFDQNMYDKFGNFKHIFCQNIAINKDNVTSIPIGMESIDWTKSHNYDKFEVIKRCRQKNKIPTKLLYGNFSLWTNFQKRIECLQNFISKEYFTNDVQKAVKHVSIMEEKEYEEFCDKILDHVFVLCPEGNGIDTHRLWETLYLGRIPIVLHNTVNDNYSELPILILDNWNEFENKQIQFIEEIINNKQFNYEKMTFKYWRETINE